MDFNEHIESNGTLADAPGWTSSPQFHVPGWFEPVLVASVLVASMILSRKRGYRVFDRQRSGYGLLGGDVDSAMASDDAIARQAMVEEDEEGMSMSGALMKYPPKVRRCCGSILYTPNTSRFEDYYHSRIMQKYPFLMEMFYWIITYAAYQFSRRLSQAKFNEKQLWDIAQDHGLAVLDFEQFSWLSFLWPIREIEVQHWFMEHPTFLTILNRSYALIHIPGTVGFIGWFYWAAPSHAVFATVRRTMTLTNFSAFFIFIIYPLMPPRFLPPEYGFVDSVGHNNAESVWMQGQYVNSLAAMPSMHFGYSFAIGCTLIYHSGIFRRVLDGSEPHRSTMWTAFYVLLGVSYPLFILTTIIATANHYWLDPTVAFFVVVLAYICNKVFLALLPLEDLLLWCLRLEKPLPTTGERYRRTLARVSKY